VIVMTGRETPAIRAAALEGGAFAFVLKPFDDEAFLSLVRPNRTTPKSERSRQMSLPAFHQ
jgi:DNA-binding NtrC family response regulator